MNKLQLKPIKLIFPFKLFDLNVIIYVNLKEGAMLNGNQNKKIK